MDLSSAAVPAWLGEGAAPGIGRFIDHTLLKPEATRTQIVALCDEARRFDVAAVCVNGCWVELCAERLEGSGVAVAGVVGFPLGAMSTEAKAAEARIAVAAGATEVDMVIALGQALAAEWGYVERDIRRVTEAAEGFPVKVILETAALTQAAIGRACSAALRAGARFAKTSTGFHPAGGATIETVSLLRRAVGSTLSVKASGGIRTIDAVIAMLAAGADRIGTSSTAAMADYLGPGAPSLSALLAGERRG